MWYESYINHKILDVGKTNKSLIKSRKTYLHIHSTVGQWLSAPGLYTEMWLPYFKWYISGYTSKYFPDPIFSRLKIYSLSKTKC